MKRKKLSDSEVVFQLVIHHVVLTTLVITAFGVELVTSSQILALLK